ncbi:MAG: sugar ABC transporter substrate-binding protein [Candidatus Heimdallarchaeaceae archaeon]
MSKNIKAVGKMVYIVILIVVAIVASVGTYFGVTMTGPKPEAKLRIGLITYPYVDAWCAAAFTTTRWYLEDHDCEVYQVVGSTDWTGLQQVKGGKALIDKGVDGIILSCCEPQVTVELVRYAKEHGVPVACFDFAPDTSDILFFVGVSQYELGREGGLMVRRLLIQKFGEANGTVLVLTMPPSRVFNKQREAGFKSVFENDANVNIVELMLPASGSLADAKKAVCSYLETGKDFDAAWSSTGGTNLGIVEALKAEGIDPATKILISTDAYPTVLDLIREGELSGSCDQPTAFYGAITAKYLIDYIEGKPIPKIGDVVTDLDIAGDLHLGYDPWAYDEEVYLPIHVVDWLSNCGSWIATTYNNTFPWYKVSVTLINETNVDLPSLWGNAPVNWAEVAAGG